MTAATDVAPPSPAANDTAVTPMKPAQRSEFASTGLTREEVS